MVEFKKCKKGEEGVHLYGREGLYKVHPVEYKKGENGKQRDVEKCSQGGVGNKIRVGVGLGDVVSG